MEAAVIRAEGLEKRFRAGLLRRRVEAVRGVSFDVQPGEIFGFVGPNGAGKTTTLKMLMGLIRPTAGRAHIFGREVTRGGGDLEARRRLGFLPENPYFYDYLTARELCEFTGQLFGLGRAERRRRAARLLEEVGLGAAADRRLRKYSKGMLQRAGIAQALMGDPELVVLDEPMTGLDPIGRKEVRDLILSLRERGKTVFFSTHILSDVELLCDRVAIIVAGQVRDVGPLHALVDPRVLSSELVVGGWPAAPAEVREPLLALARSSRTLGERTLLVLDAAEVDRALQLALDGGLEVVSLVPRRESLEDVFVREAQKSGDGARATA